MTTVTVSVTDLAGHTVLQTVNVAVDAGSSFDQTATGDYPNGFTVPAGENWKIQGLVTTPKNVIVNGTLTMRAGDTLRFRNVDESAFVGGGLDPLATDVGLWVMGSGMLDACGTDKAGWNRAGTDPSWLPGDEIRVCPTAVGDYTNFAVFTPGSPVPNVGHGMPNTEVFNLTRDCNIEGTPTGRAHVFIRSMMPQMICHTGFRYLGPNKAGAFVLGRWALHFHHCMDGSRGSMVESCVVRDCGSHAIVPHMSDGITFTDCVAYNCVGDPYWWDIDEVSNDVVYDRCAAFYATNDPSAPTALSGFALMKGDGNKANGCVAVGMKGAASGAGVNWEEGSAISIWEADDCVTHNNGGNGGRTWQNQVSATRPSPTIYRFVSYRNGTRGFKHGAYGNGIGFVDCKFFDNAMSSFESNANSGPHQQIVLLRPHFYGGPQIPFVSNDHAFAGITPVLVQDGMFTLYGGQAVEIAEDPPITPGTVKVTFTDFVNCVTSTGGGLEPAMFKMTYLRAGGRVRVQRTDGTAYQFTAGENNAWVLSTIPTFA